jgi:DNA-binding transcriptional MerR regulator
MSDDGNIQISAALPISEIERVLSRIVARSLEDRAREIGVSLEEVRDAARDKQRQVREEVEALFDKTLATKVDVETRLDDLQEKINKKANRYLIPVATIILLAGILALWAVVGGVVFKLREDVTKADGEVETLKQQVAAKQKDLEKLEADLKEAQGKIKSIMDGTVIGQLDARLKVLEGVLRTAQSPPIIVTPKKPAGKIPSGKSGA